MTTSALPQNVDTAVIVLTMNQRDKTLRCLESLRAVHGASFAVVLWDNASSDGTVEAARQSFPEVLTHHHETNLGVASGRNAAARMAAEQFDCRYFLFLDNDTTVDPDVIRLLRAPFEGDPRLAQTTPKIRFYNDHSILYGARGCGVNFLTGRTTHIGYREIDRGQYDERSACIPSGGCMVVRRDVFERLGGFDAIFDPYGPEDLDFGFRVREAGYTALYIPEAVIYHDPSPGKTISQGQYTEMYASYRSKHWLRFMRRHATAMQRAGFYAIGAPYLLLRVLVREGRKGNFSAIKGLIRGGWDSARSSGSDRR